MSSITTPKKAVAKGHCSHCPGTCHEKAAVEVESPTAESPKVESPTAESLTVEAPTVEDMDTRADTPESKTDDTNEVSAGCGSPSLSVRSLAVSTSSPQVPESPSVPLPDPDVFWAAVVTHNRNNMSGTYVPPPPGDSTGTVDDVGTEDNTGTVDVAGTEDKTDTAQEAGTEGTSSTAFSVPGTPKANSSVTPAVFNSDMPNDTEVTTPNSKRDASFLNPKAPTFLPPAESPSFFSRDFTLPDDVSQLDLSDANLPGLEHPKVNLPKITVTNHQDTMMTFKTISYHIDADLAVKVQDEHGVQVFKVHSALIAAASPIWRQKIYGGEYARPKTGDWVISMCDNDEHAAGLDVIFSLIHYKFHEIPARPGMNLLYRVAQVANKYACVHLLVPFTSKWIEGMDKQMILTNQSGDDFEKTLFITWVFGDPCWFSHSLSHVAYRATLDFTSGDLLSGVGVPLEQYCLPSSLIDIIAKTRANAISKMLSMLGDTLLDLASQGDTTGCRSEKADEDSREICQMMQLGSLMRGLTKAKLNPLPQVGQYKGSALSLGNQLEEMKVSHYKNPGVKSREDSHANCGFRGKDITGEAMPEGIDLPGDLLHALKGQALKSGAYHADVFENLTGLINDASYEEADTSSRLAEEMFLRKIHYKQVEGTATLCDGLGPIIEEDLSDGSDETHEEIPTSTHEDVAVASKVEAPVVDTQEVDTQEVDTQEVDTQEVEGTSEATTEEPLAVDTKEDVTGASTDNGSHDDDKSFAVDTKEDVTGSSADNESHDDKVRMDKANTKIRCHHCHHVSDEESDESVVIKTE